MFDQNNISQNQDSQIEIVTPVTENGVEFYSSKINSERGVSQRGLARLCGVDEKTIRRLLEGLELRNFAPSECLKHLRGTDLYCGISSPHQAKVIKSSVAASIISYYALERKNPTSTLSLQLFAVIGFDSWIDKITGNQPAQDPINSSNDTHELLKQVMAEVIQLKECNQKYSRVKKEYPVLDNWLKNISDQETQNLIAPAKDEKENTYTIKEALAVLFPGTSFSSTIHRQVALKCGQIISGLTGDKMPKKVTANGKGYDMEVNSYTSAQLPLIKLVLQTAL
jgi:hypothetical protein